MAWVAWALQAVILLPTPLISFAVGSFANDVGLGLGLMQNALWASAILCLYPRQLSRKWLGLPVLSMLAIVITAVASRTAILASGTFKLIDAVSAAIIFTLFVLWIFQWDLNKKIVAVFSLHACSQVIWRSLWFPPLGGTQIAILLLSPIWRSVLLFAWIRLIATMVKRADESFEKAVTGIQQLKLPNPLNTFNVMISSTILDLERERDAADGAILGMHLSRFRAEKLGSVGLSPQEICALMAKQCDILVLIIGERYGYILEPEGLSVVEFEYRIARDDNPRKILVYVKEGVKREEKEIKFLESVQKFKDGYLTWSFSTPEKLAEQIPPDIMRLLTSLAKQNKPKE